MCESKDYEVAVKSAGSSFAGQALHRPICRFRLRHHTTRTNRPADVHIDQRRTVRHGLSDQPSVAVMAEPLPPLMSEFRAGDRYLEGDRDQVAG
jgi:hypothetical protein